MAAGAAHELLLSRARIDHLPELMTIAEVAPVLRMGTSTAYAAIKRDAFPLPILRVGGRMLISRYQLARWLGVEPAEATAGTGPVSADEPAVG
jgi:excisionase family DNA binding protein